MVDHMRGWRHERLCFVVRCMVVTGGERVFASARQDVRRSPDASAVLVGDEPFFDVLAGELGFVVPAANKRWGRSGTRVSVRCELTLICGDARLRRCFDAAFVRRAIGDLLAAIG